MHPFLYTVNLPKLTFVLFQISRNFSASSCFMGPLVAQVVKNLPAMQETQVQSLGREVPLKKGIATHSSIFAWRIPSDRLQSVGSQRVRDDLAQQEQQGKTLGERLTSLLLHFFVVVV